MSATCPTCGSAVTVTERLLGGWAKARCLSDGVVMVRPGADPGDHYAYPNPPTVLPTRGSARASDPETSAEAAEAMDPTGQHRALLEAFARIGPANLSVVAEAAGLTEHQTSRRLSELERAGRIAWTGLTALGPTGRRQRVLALVRVEA